MNWFHIYTHKQFFSAFGCNGAYASAHFEWYQNKNEGHFQYESCYPYTAREDPCNNDQNCNYEKSKQASYSIIQNPTEEELKELVYSIPVYTLVNVRHSFESSLMTLLTFYRLQHKISRFLNVKSI